MKRFKKCLQIDPAKKIIIKIDADGKILYLNNYFAEFTGNKIHEYIMQDFSKLFHDKAPKTIRNIIFEIIENSELAYFFYLGKTKNGNCYWGLVKSIQFLDAEGYIDRYKLEVKMLPPLYVNKIEELMNTIFEIEETAGTIAAKKYFENFLDENDWNYQQFTLNILDLKKKKIEEYFRVDIEEYERKNQKKSWF